MWSYRWMLCIPWPAEVVQPMRTGEKSIGVVKSRKAAYFGHIVRHNNTQRAVLMGKMNGRRPRGRRRLDWMRNIKVWTGKHI